MKLWIARDKDWRHIEIYENEPEKWIEDGIFVGNSLLTIDASEFPSVTWKNSPQQVELKLPDKNYE